jgi:hypothetical protein
MLPDFVDGFNLPLAAHTCTLDEVYERFGLGECRTSLCDRLKDIYDRAKRCGFSKIAIWGSFPTSKPEPNDLDILFVLPKTLNQEHLSDCCKQLLDSANSRSTFGCDVLNCSDDPEVLDYLMRMIGIDREGRERGWLELELQ